MFNHFDFFWVTPSFYRSTFNLLISISRGVSFHVFFFCLFFFGDQRISIDMYYLKLVVTNAETLASDLQLFAEWKETSSHG